MIRQDISSAHRAHRGLVTSPGLERLDILNAYTQARQKSVRVELMDDLT
jgi:hypothetical protein